MKYPILPAIAVGLLSSALLQAHRLDEYLQATLITPAPDHVDLEVNLTPGVAVLSSVLAAIDSDQDGRISPAEQAAYVRRLLGDLEFSSDGKRLNLKLRDWRFPPVGEMQEGVGIIRLRMTADMPASRGKTHQFSFHNSHEPLISAYLVNVVVPDDGRLAVTRQDRDYFQNSIQVTYTLQSAGTPLSATFREVEAALQAMEIPPWLLAIGFLAFVRRLVQRQRRVRASSGDLPLEPQAMP